MPEIEWIRFETPPGGPNRIVHGYDDGSTKAWTADEAALYLADNPDRPQAAGDLIAIGVDPDFLAELINPSTPLTDGPDTFEGAESDDFIAGLDGSDTLRGNGGNDRLFGSGASFQGELLYTFDFSFSASPAELARLENIDTLEGGDGDDTLIGGSDRNFLLAGAGDDTVIAPTGGRVFVFSAADGYDHPVFTYANIIDGGDGDDSITANFGFSKIDGGAGNDEIEAFGGSQILAGAGNDVVRAAATVLLGGDGDDVLTLTGYVASEYFARRVKFEGGSGDDVLIGAAKEDHIRGGEDNDTIDGRGGRDLIYGEGGNDRLIAGERGDSIRDILRGGDGSDVFIADGGRNDLFGDAGQDFVSYELFTEGVTINYNATGTMIGADRVYDVEGVIGGAGDDQINGSQNRDILDGAIGNDIVNGHDGDDFIRGLYGNDRLSGGLGNDVAIGDSGADVIDGGDGDDKLYGGAGDDELWGGEGRDVFLGGSGNDAMFGEGGNDMFLAYAASSLNLFDGGDGVDMVSYAGSGAAIEIDLRNTLSNFGDAAGHTYAGIERYLLSRHSDTIIAGTESAYILAGSGDDTLRGSSIGVDTLLGQNGNDRIFGGAGIDKIFGGSGDDLIYANVPGGDGAADQLIFTSETDGRARIADFENDFDHIYLIGIDGLDSFDDLAIGQDAHGNAVAAFGQLELRFLGFDSANLDSGDFVFA